MYYPLLEFATFEYLVGDEVGRKRECKKYAGSELAQDNFESAARMQSSVNTILSERTDLSRLGCPDVERETDHQQFHVLNTLVPSAPEISSIVRQNVALLLKRSMNGRAVPPQCIRNEKELTT